MRDLDLRVMRGDRIGLIGPNGAGKTTLLKLILGELAARRGHACGAARSCRSPTSTRCARRSTPSDARRDTISPGCDGSRSAAGRKHVLELPRRLPVLAAARALAGASTLSGGERNRLLLARLFAQPANVLVLDEPTNDLDIEIARAARGDCCRRYAGTLLLVSHDRALPRQRRHADARVRGRRRVARIRRRLQRLARAAPAARRAAAPRARRAQAARAPPTTPPAPARLCVQGEARAGGAAGRARGARAGAARADRTDVRARLPSPGRRRRSRRTGARAQEIERLLAAKFERWGTLDARAGDGVGTK